MKLKVIWNSHSFKDISIALSGGVDSTLILSLLRKTNPDPKINAVSIKFANSVDETPAAAKIAERFEAEHHVIELGRIIFLNYQKQSALLNCHFGICIGTMS